MPYAGDSFAWFGGVAEVEHDARWLADGNLGHPAVRGNAIKVALVLGFTLVSLPVFATAGQVAWREGLALAVGGAFGGVAMIVGW